MTALALTQASVAEQLWFLDTLMTIHVAHAEGADGMSVIETHAPYGDSPPLHVHHTEDEVFHVLDGELLLKVGEDEISASAGAILLAPKGVAHTFKVVSPQGARFLTTTTEGDFEAMVRAASRPAERSELPAPSGPPSPEQVAALAELCAAHGVDLVGPPLM
jgi:quercetin dioxygenase-like cupin family protein